MTPKYTPAQIRLALQHPLPWKYDKVDPQKNPFNSIVDATGKEILREDQVSQVVFDAVWDLGFGMNTV